MTWHYRGPLARVKRYSQTFYFSVATYSLRFIIDVCVYHERRRYLLHHRFRAVRREAVQLHPDYLNSGDALTTARVLDAFRWTYT
jgi:hypothetical protein